MRALALCLLVSLMAISLGCASGKRGEAPSAESFDARAALDKEAETLPDTPFVTSDGQLRVMVPGRATEIEEIEGYYGLEIDAGSQSRIACFLYPKGLHLATAISAMAEQMISKEAEPGLDTRQVADVDAGSVDGYPFVGVQWLYRVNQDGVKALGQLTIYSALKHGIGIACIQNELGYERTFFRAFEAVVGSLEVPGMMPPMPYYSEVALLSIGDRKVGVTRLSLQRDSDGDTAIATSTAMLLQTGPGQVSSLDTYEMEFSTESGRLINQWSQSIDDGALTTELSLRRAAEAEWSVEGTFQGNPFEARLEHGELPSSLRQMRELRSAIESGGAGVEVSHVVWSSESDPSAVQTSNVQVLGTLGRNEYDALITLGDATMKGVMDETGSLKQASMSLDGITVDMERIYRSGVF